VAYQFPVNDCQRFERIVHEKLGPLRQKNREFFNVTAAVAFDAVQSVLDKQPEIKMVDPKDIGEPPTTPVAKNIKKSRQNKFRQGDSEYTEALSLFTKVTECKGRPFGQLNKPYFGMSDGNEGVQWNIKIFSDTGEAQFGVNLEGKKYTNWPISDFLLNEIKNPQIFNVRDQLTYADQIFLNLRRDAWQATARPDILEGVIGVGNISLQDIDPNLWKSMLDEALACLSEEKDYRSRATQNITLKGQPSRGGRRRKMGVSPHLTIWTSVALSGDVETQLKIGIDRLTPIYDWVSKASQSG